MKEGERERWPSLSHKREASEKIVPPIIVAKNIDIVDLPQKKKFCKNVPKNLHMSKICCTFAASKVVNDKRKECYVRF